MSWEMRQGRRCYYSASWADGRVRKVYHGSGVLAELAASQDAEARARRHASAKAVIEEEARLRPADLALEELDQACERALSASLLVAGFHRVQLLSLEATP